MNNTLISPEYTEVLEKTFQPGKTVTKAGWIRSEAAQTLEAVRLACESFLKEYAREAAEGREQHPHDYCDALRSIANRLGGEITTLEAKKTQWKPPKGFFTHEEIFEGVWEYDSSSALEIVYSKLDVLYSHIEEFYTGEPDDMIEESIREACIWYNTFRRLYHFHRIADAGKGGYYLDIDLRHAQLAIDVEEKHKRILEIAEEMKKGEN